MHSSNPYPFSQALWQNLLISFATWHDSNSRLCQLPLAWWFWPIYWTYLCPGFLICRIDILSHFPHVRINQMPAKNWRQWLAHSKHSECQLLFFLVLLYLHIVICGHIKYTSNNGSLLISFSWKFSLEHQFLSYVFNWFHISFICLF